MNTRFADRISRNPGAQSWLVLAGFLGLTLLLRLGSFPKSVIDFDESFYLLMGRSLLRGEIPYTTVTSHDPIGTAVLFALAQMIFGQSVLAIRLLTWLAAGLECFLLYRLAVVALGRRGVTIGLVAGTLYAFFTLINLGLAAHREMFLAPCVTFAVYMVVSGIPQNYRSTGADWPEGRVEAPLRQAQGAQSFALYSPRAARLVLAGLAMGFALLLKHTYVLELAAVSLIATGLVISERRGERRAVIPVLLKSYGLLVAGPLLLAGLAGIYFVLVGHWGDFFETNVRAALSYAGAESYDWANLFRRVLAQIQSNTLLWLGVFLAPFYLAFIQDTEHEERRALRGWLTWFLLAFLGTCITRKFFEHYYLQLVPAASLITATVIAGVLSTIAAQGRARYVLALMLVLVGPLFAMGYWPLFDTAALAYRHYLRGQPLPMDGPKAVSAYLQERVTPDDYLYVADYEPIVNYMVDARIPTRYAFSIYLTDQIFAREGIDQVGELRRIFDKRPLYVVKQSPPSPDFVNPPFAAELEEHLVQDYVLEKTFPAIATFTARPITVEIYRLRSCP